MLKNTHLKFRANQKSEKMVENDVFLLVCGPYVDK